MEQAVHVLFNPMPENPAGIWELKEQPHELLFAETAFRGFELGLTLDYHLPSCRRGVKHLKEDLKAFLLAVTKDLDLEALPKTVFGAKPDKYRAYSEMQKAIRRSDALAAWRPAHALFTAKDASSMWRRLAIVALEDVGPGDPYGMALTLRVVTDKQIRAEAGELELLWYLIQRLAAAPKSRDLCDIDVWCELAAPMTDAVGNTLWMGGAQLVNEAANSNAAFVDRLACLYRLSGKFPKLTKHGNPPVDKALRHFHDAVKLPPLFRYVSSTGLGWMQSAMAMILPLVWQMVCASPEVKVGPDPFLEFKDDVKIGKCYAATLDKHTWTGKAAIGRFCGHKPIHEWFAAHPWVEAKKAMERAVFYVEGAILIPRLGYYGAESIFWDVLKDKLALNGFKSFEEGLEFYALVGANLAALHKMRGLE
jgi:hypothetical protein